MKSDISNAESQFAVLCANLNSLGMQIITQYEGQITQLVEQVKAKDGEIAALKEKYENQGEAKTDATS